MARLAGFLLLATLALTLSGLSSVAARKPAPHKAADTPRPSGPRIVERALGDAQNPKRPYSSLWPSTPTAEPHLAADGATVPIVDARRVAGYFLLDRTKEAQMFYFLFRSRSRDTDPLVLWMTGGPGCSSELAVFYENGPYSINKNLTLSETPNGWDKYHNLLFVDQPINTGFSYSHDEEDRVYSEATVAEDMLDFLQEFFAVHPDLAERDLFITGESYAGHYVPAVSHRVWLANRNAEGVPIKLKGIAIGNGLTNPAIQYGAYADFALDNGLITQGTHDSIQWWFPVCRWAINLCNSHPWQVICRGALTWCQTSVFAPIMIANAGMNVYDITKKCEGPLCYDFTAADLFLNNAVVQASLGVDGIPWEGCNMDVNSDMQGDFLLAYHELLPEMLADGLRVMIYAGELDFICNWLGNARWVAALQWDGQQDWAVAPDADWTSSSGSAAGSVREVGPLSFVKVFKAGHMVPMDQPENALEMITKFTRGVSLADYSAGAAVLTPAAEVVAPHPDKKEGVPMLVLKVALGRHQAADVAVAASK